MPLIDRYISRLIAWPLVATVIIAIMLLLLDNMLRLFQFAIALGGPLSVIWKMLASLIPEYLSLGLTIGLFLSISIAYRGLALSNELDMIISSGLSERRLLKVPFIMAAVICVINFVLVGFVEPRGERMFELLHRDMAAGILGITINAGEFTKVSDNLMMRVNEMRDGSNDMRGIFFRRVDEKGEQWVGTSRQGKIVVDPAQKNLILRLTNGTIFRTSPSEAKPALMAFDTLDVDIKSRKQTTLLLPPSKLSQFTLPELWRMGHDPQKDEDVRRAALAKFFRRMVQAIFCLFLPPLAVALSIPPKRLSNAYGLFVGLVIVVAFMKIADGAEGMAASRALDPLLAQAVPMVVFAALSGWAFHLMVSGERGHLVGMIDRSFTAVIDNAMRVMTAGRSIVRIRWPFGGVRSKKPRKPEADVLAGSVPAAPQPAKRGRMLMQAQRILIVFESFELGGTERIALRLAEVWAQAGRDVTIFAGRPDGPLLAMLPHGVAVAGPDRVIPKGPLSGVRLALGIRRDLAFLQPDIIFCPGNYYTDTAVMLRILAGGSCPPIVAKISNALRRQDMSAPVQIAYELWLNLQKQFIDLYVAMSPALAAEARSVMGLGPDDIVVIKDPALPSRASQQAAARDEFPERPSRPYILAVGRLVRQKNFAALLRSFAMLAKVRDIDLVILGDGDQRDMLEEEIRRRGLEGRVTLADYVSKVDAWLRHAALFVLSSTYEGLPAVLIEAMSRGVPIVSTNCSAAIDELLEGGRLGAIVPVNDDAALAAAMEQQLVAVHDPEPLRQKAMEYRIDVGGAAYLNAFDVTIRALPRHSAVIKKTVLSYG